MSSTVRRLAGVAAGRGVQILAALLTLVLLARWFSPADAALLILALAAAAFAAALGEFGLSRTLTRAIAEARAAGRPELAKAWLAAAVRWGGWAGGAVALATWATVLLMPALSAAAAQTALLAGAMAVIGVLAGALRGDDRPGSAAFLANACPPLWQLLALLALAAMDRLSAATVLWCWALGAATTAGAACVVIRLRCRGAGRQPVGFTGLVRSATPAWGVSLAGTAFGQLDVILAGWLLSSGQLAAYGVANRLAALLGLGLVFFNQASSAQIVTLHVQGRRADLEHMLVRSSGWALVAAGAGWVAVLVLGPLVFAPLFGEHYLAALPIFAILGLRQVVSCGIGSAAHVLNLCWDQRRLAWLSVSLLALWCAVTGLGGWLAGTLGLATGSLIGFAAYKGVLARVAGVHLGVRSGCALPRPVRPHEPEGRENHV